MTQVRPLRAFEDMRDALLAALAPAEPRRVEPRAALGRIAAADVAAPGLVPARALASRDGFALRSAEIVGASAYAPVALAEPPAYVRRGEALPDGCDCLLDAGALDLAGPGASVLQEAYPGENIRRAGEDAASGATLVAQGRRLAARDVVALEQAGVEGLDIREPRVALRGGGAAAIFLARALANVGAALVASDAHLIVALGEAAECGQVALEPGRDAAIVLGDDAPLVVCPPSLDQALATFHAILLPALDRLCGRETPSLRLPLARKIASRVGVAELVLLRAEDGSFAPLATGDWPMQSWLAATHVALVSSRSEGHAAGDVIAATPFVEGIV